MYGLGAAVTDSREGCKAEVDRIGRLLCRSVLQWGFKVNCAGRRFHLSCNTTPCALPVDPMPGKLCNTYRLNPLRMRKPWCYGSQGEEAPNHQPGSHQQDKCKGHLGDDECILSAELSGPVGRASCALNSARDAGPEDPRQSEQQARPHRACE